MLRSGPGKASTQAQSDLPADVSQKEVDRASDSSVAGTIIFECPALLPLQLVQEDNDDESKTLPCDSLIKTNGRKTETLSM